MSRVKMNSAARNNAVMKRWPQMTALVVLGLGVLFYFQNCSNVRLQKPPPVIPGVSFSAMASICFANEYAGYTLKSATATNLNLLFKNGVPFTDSDADGLSDDDEISYGTNPLNRRTSGKVLDKVCFDLSDGTNCAALAQDCSGQNQGLGISDCDAEALNLDSLTQVKKGIDADRDGMIDLLELIRGTVVSRQDSLEDPDHDYVLNFEELNLGTNPLYYDSDTKGDYKTALTAGLNQQPDAPCVGEAWDIHVEHVPIVRSPAYSGAGDFAGANMLPLSHGANQNRVLILLVLKPILGTGNFIYLYKNLLLSDTSQSMSLGLQDFARAGEVAQ